GGPARGAPPSYHPPTDDDVYEFVEAVASSADGGIVLYTTYWKGYQPPLELIERLAELPQLIGLKWASPSMTTFEKGLRLFAKRLCVIDNNFPFVYSHLLGARGINPHPSNYWPEWGVRLWGLLEAGEDPEAQGEGFPPLPPHYRPSAGSERSTRGRGPPGQALPGADRPGLQPVPSAHARHSLPFPRQGPADAASLWGAPRPLKCRGSPPWFPKRGEGEAQAHPLTPNPSPPKRG